MHFTEIKKVCIVKVLNETRGCAVYNDESTISSKEHIATFVEDLKPSLKTIMTVTKKKYKKRKKKTRFDIVNALVPYKMLL